MKTRKIGGASFAELKIKIDPTLTVEEANKITKILEERLLKNIAELKYIVISIQPHEIERETILSQFGPKICVTEGFEKLGPKKLGKRRETTSTTIMAGSSPPDNEWGNVRCLTISISSWTD